MLSLGDIEPLLPTGGHASADAVTPSLRQFTARARRCALC